MTNFRLIALLSIVIGISSCGGDTKPTEKKEIKTDSLAKVDTVVLKQENTEELISNDSLNELARFIAGIDLADSSKILKDAFTKPEFKTFSASFEKRWHTFDSSRLTKLNSFRDQNISTNVGETKTLFYPFSGPDILYGYTFFPEADKYVMMGLEPVGTLPIYEDMGNRDSLKNYFGKINTSLNAILKFSFFRTESMNKDLRNKELDGTLHVLFLFLARTGNSIVSAKPLAIDSTGKEVWFNTFTELQNANYKSKAIEIKFFGKEKELKTLYYFSVNLADDHYNKNAGMQKWLSANVTDFNTYLKGASYLLHYASFSTIRNFILDNTKHVTQDDSGIAYRYFEKRGKWDYLFYGKYRRPLSLFPGCYQPELDSLYKQVGSKDVGFGIGYNFKDQNSNLMIATKKQ